MRSVHECKERRFLRANRFACWADTITRPTRRSASGVDWPAQPMCRSC